MFSTTRWNWWLLTPIRIINWCRLCKNRIEVMCEKEMLYLLTRSGPGTAKSSPLCNWSRILDLELKRSHKQYVDTDDAILLELRFFKQSINHLLKMNICYIQNCNFAYSLTVLNYFIVYRRMYFFFRIDKKRSVYLITKQQRKNDAWW
jgi:hypothetical protein